MRRSSVFFSLLLFGCEPTSTLEQAHESGAEPAKPEPGTKVDPPKQPDRPAGETEPVDVAIEDQPSDAPLDPDGIPIPSLVGAAKVYASGDASVQVDLRLALVEGSTYRITTIGMLFLPLIDKATGFAREEDLGLSHCTGEGADRHCTLTHTFRNYEAEPPTGAGLEAEERTVSGIVSSHPIDASGLRSAETSLTGDAASLANPAAKALAHAHEFLCIRLPSEPVGVGAIWKDVCRRRQSGMLVTRDLTWKLAKLEDSEDGKRAELHYAGNVWTKDDKGVRKGRIAGVLYFLVDAGEPHLQRERVEFIIDADNGIKTKTDLRYQWAKLGKDGETVIRTDGKPFAEKPLDLTDVSGQAAKQGEEKAADPPKPG